MSIKDIVRREGEENGEKKPNMLGATLVFGAFLMLIYAFPRYITTQDIKRR